MKTERDVTWIALIAALDAMETQSKTDHPDETVQWAINELSDKGHDYLFGPRRKVLDAYKAWKSANSECSNCGGYGSLGVSADEGVAIGPKCVQCNGTGFQVR